jgi:hypothetical protein
VFFGSPPRSSQSGIEPASLAQEGEKRTGTTLSGRVSITRPEFLPSGH